MKLKFIRLYIIPVVLCFYTTAFSTTYYLSPGGSDANTGTSISAPFLTLAKAVSKAIVAGDSILVRSGTYPVTTTVKITKSGTAANHIVLTVYIPDMVNAYSRPVFDFSAMSVSSSNIGISISGVAYWDIYGIIVKGAGDNGMLLQSSVHHTKIEFCSFLRNRDSGLQIRSGSHHCLILNCDSYENADLGAGTTTSGGNADGFAPKLDVGDSIIFRGCRAWLNSDDGWDGYLKTTGSSYPDNITTILEDCWAFRNGYYWLDGSTTTSQNGNGIKMGGSDLKDEAHNFVLIRCLTFRNKAKGFDQNNNAGSMFLYNCTAHRNGGSDFGLNSSGVTYASNAVLVLRNNLSLGSSGASIRAAGTPPTGTPVTRTTNFFVTGTTSTNYASLDSTGVTNPRNVDGSLPPTTYMHLQTAPASSYINSGTELSTVLYHDGIGVPYNETAIDLGAFETGLFALSAYTFTGNGNWDVSVNWQYNYKPPATMPAGTQIIINPIWSGECVLNQPYTLSPGSSITVKSGKKFRIPDFLTIAN